MWNLTLGRSACATLFLTSLCIASTASGDVVLFVDDDAPPGGDGMSWDSAYRFLQVAFAFADQQGNFTLEIRAAQGVYQPDRTQDNSKGSGDRSETFRLVYQMKLRGGYAGIGAVDPDARDFDLYETILSGDLAGDDDPNDIFGHNDDNSYHVINGNSTFPEALLEGLTITAGNADGFSAQNNDRGGGLILANGDATVSDCRFVDNYARKGGAVSCNNADPTITGTDFIGNIAAQSAGAFHEVGGNPVIQKCNFISNSAEDGFGGAISASNGNPFAITLTILDCLFEGNTSLNWGGGAIASSSNNLTISGCTFQDNHAVTSGGAIANGSDEAFISNCVFEGNTVIQRAGAIYNALHSVVTFSNCSFADNESELLGGGMYNSIYSQILLTDCQFTNNTASIGGGLYNESDDSVLMDVTFNSNNAGTGGALFNNKRIIPITQCTFESNNAIFGGAIYDNEGEPQITLSIFDDNYAIIKGGAIYSDTGAASIDQCSFTSNFSSEEGAAIYSIISQLLVTNSMFFNNLAGKDGGGIYNDHSDMLIEDSNFQSNSAIDNDGGAIFNSSSTFTAINSSFLYNSSYLGDGGCMYNLLSDIILTNCSIEESSTSNGNGAAIYNDTSTIELLNCALIGNTAFSLQSDGGGIYNVSSDSTLINCTVCSNSANKGPGIFNTAESNATISGSIFWNNRGYEDLFNEDLSETTVTYSDIQDEWPGVGNISIDPLFTQAGSFNCRLSPGSPCIDAGDNLTIPKGFDFDLDGNPRFIDDPCAVDTGSGNAPIVDMGAYEFQGSSCDLNSDGFVNTNDLLMLFANWGPCADCDKCPIDLDDDCSVGIPDLEILLDNWG